MGDLATLSAGPKRTETLRARRSPLAHVDRQLELLRNVNLESTQFGGDFQRAIASCNPAGLKAEKIETLQLNLGRLCNMTCRHCHVDAGPDRWREVMDRETVDACIDLLAKVDPETVDLTGGAPELNPNFRYLVDECVSGGKHIIDRCNLTVLLLRRNEDLPKWLASRGVEIVCSLPHHRQRNTDAQRGEGAFDKSIKALRRLNDVGYGRGDPTKRLTLMVNPVGAFLAADQCALQQEWTRSLRENHGVTFDNLSALNNMPISRYLEWLETSGNLTSYMKTLVTAFNPATVARLMCRSTLSVGWDGKVYDCDFNQMLEMPLRTPEGDAINVSELPVEHLLGRRVKTGRHCFGCTAGAGSSCGGAIDG
ncbi:MAG: radical SAM/Cys-rich domain protein [bacterium]|nr:radical SAM/Cys-rich domain protein [bacterium]